MGNVRDYPAAPPLPPGDRPARAHVAPAPAEDRLAVLLLADVGTFVTSGALMLTGEVTTWV